MSLESRISYELNKHPGIKKTIKRVYQRSMYTISPKIKSEGNIVRISPDDGKEYFFGYYDKSPWDATGRYMLCLRANNTWSDVSPKERADILVIDTQKSEGDKDRVKKIAETSAWNVQQSCMLQWLGPDFSSKVLYNDCRDGKYCSVILELETGKERILPAAVYTVAADGKTALTLDFSRLYNLRPGYGYYNVPEKTKGTALPDETAIWSIDLESGVVSPLLKYTDFASFQPRKEMLEEGSVHKVNHLMISPNGKRFMVLYRWFVGQRKYTRLITCNVDGTDMYVLSDDDMVSHCYWKNDEEILAFENKNDGGQGYYLMTDRTRNYMRLWPHISNDGHPSYSPDGKLVVTDSYPNRVRLANIKVMNNQENIVLASVFAPFKYDNDTRCDLHPRWSRDGKQICFDSVFEGHRGLYTVSIDGITFADDESVATKYDSVNGKAKKKIVYIMTSCKKTGPTQQTLNIIKNLDQTKFEPTLITLYEEEIDSKLADYLPYIKEHRFIKTGKKNIMLGRISNLEIVLEEIKPDLIHTVGVFPDYAISKLGGRYKQVLTLRQYVYEDFPAKYGKFKGIVLAKMHLYAMSHTSKTVACSKSLSMIYKEKLNREYDYIQNGVDIDKFTAPTLEEISSVREELSLPKDKFIFVYTGQLIERKNMPFLLQGFTEEFGNEENTHLLVLGDGSEYEELKVQYGKYNNVDFRGSVSNVNQYLKGCDVYVSASKSESLPNGVLEAMATGLPVVLSDIEQHKEIYVENTEIGYLFKQGDLEDYKSKLRQIKISGAKEAGKTAFETAHELFSAPKMSKKYQNLYMEVINK